jgi:cytochrome c553
VQVIEAARVPKTYVAGAMLAKVPGGGDEPIGPRIIEVPVELARAENRDARTPYLAFVPPGSIARGAALVTQDSAGKTVRCATCHGATLQGLGDVPRLVGRSPSYLLRQLYDVQVGARKGSSALMQPVVAKLSLDDMIAIAAYLASRAP